MITQVLTIKFFKMKEISQILKITQALRDKYSHLGKQFTLDGKLVGDIGEVLVSEKYGIELYDENAPIHDGYEIATGRKVQIKSSFKYYSYFPYGDVPEYFLSVNISENGDLEELFNGPGRYIVEHYIVARKLKPYRKTFYTLSKGVLLKLNEQVPKEDKIKVIE